MIYTVTPDTAIRIGADGDDEIIQNVALILLTRRGTCPGYRQFGLSQNYIGVSERAALCILRNELADAMQFEPRARLVSVKAELSPEGHLEPIVEVEI